jgi:carboxypeptidase PM20D1
VVPPRAIAQIDVRMLPDTDGEALLAELKSALGPAVSVAVLLTEPASAPSTTDTSLHRLLVRVLGAEAPVMPYFSPGFTDSRAFRRRGIPAYGISPFTLEPQDALGIHGADEKIPLEQLDRGVDRLRRIVAGWVAAA